MNDIADRKFRDYATRVSFNLSLTRNQIAVLRTIRFELTLPVSKLYGANSNRAHSFTRQDMSMSGPDVWVLGARKLCEIGIVEWHDPGAMTPKWSEHPYRLTRAGEMVCELLEIAGLIPCLKDEKKRRSA